MGKSIYRAKTLFSGAVIGKNINTLYAGIPDHLKNDQIKVIHNKDFMIIEDWNKAEAYRVFEDKFNRNKNYTLGYFKWIPDSEKPPEQISLI